MSDKEIQGLIQNAFQKTLKEFQENPDNVFNYLELQEKYNRVLKDKVNLQKESQKYKEVIDRAINYIEWHSKFIFGKAERRFSDGKLECADGVEVFTGSPTKLLDILKEVK